MSDEASGVTTWSNSISSFVLKLFGSQSTIDDTKEKRLRSTDQTPLRTDEVAQCPSSSPIEKSKWEKMKEFCADENTTFEKWLTMRSMQLAFASQTVLDLVTRIVVARVKGRNSGIVPARISSGAIVRKSMLSGFAMAANIGCIVTAVTQYAAWRGYFSLWTVPCATGVIPVIFSYPLGLKPLLAMKSGVIFGIWTSVVIFGASLFCDLSVNEAYQRFKRDNELDLMEERESDLFKYMKKHHIYSKRLAKWMMDRNCATSSTTDCRSNSSERSDVVV